jgi:hypothetical protein
MHVLSHTGKISYEDTEEYQERLAEEKEASQPEVSR